MPIVDRGSRRMQAARPAATLPGRDVEMAVAITVVRRLGFAATKVHQAVMASLIRQGYQQEAELFNDCFKPLCDMLLHFDVSREPVTEVDDGNDEA